MADSLEDFSTWQFAYGGTTRTVYERGSGPAVIVMEEIPGITPAVADFARRVAALGATVLVPQLFGTPGKDPNPAYALTSLVPACVNREFHAFATGVTAPVTDWLRALARDAHERCGGPGVGAVGMCFTGGFALGMMVDDRMLAPVMSQPSLPIVVPWRKDGPSDVHLSPEDLARVRERAAEGACVMALRFTGDRLVPEQRFRRLRDELGEAFIAVEIDSSPGNPHGIGRLAHSVLTEELVDEPGHPTHEALVAVLGFLRERLGLSVAHPEP